MRWTRGRIRSILAELIEENAMAVRPVLKILAIEFTERVPTLAVTCVTEPVLMINPAFLNKHCKTDAHVKACLLHEFLHVLLAHTERFKQMTHMQNFALDAVINAIIHRSMGPYYSSFFAEFYATVDGLHALLKPPPEVSLWMLDQRYPDSPFNGIWLDLYEGRLVSDDILGLAEQFQKKSNGSSSSGESTHGPSQESTESPADESPHAPTSEPLLIGNHDHVPIVTTTLDEALGESLRQMNGSGVFRSPRDRGVGAPLRPEDVNPSEAKVKRWETQTLRVLEKHVLPDPRTRHTRLQDRGYRVPVLGPGDRRGFMRALWSPILPDSDWTTQTAVPRPTAQVYLDVSGSMDNEMPDIIRLLHQLRAFIRMPFYAFSTEVCPATIRNGRLVTESTGGTSMNSVLEHIGRTKPSAAVVVTDGYIERVDPGLLSAVRGTRIAAIVTRDGSPSQLHCAKIPYSQLEKKPL